MTTDTALSMSLLAGALAGSSVAILIGLATDLAPAVRDILMPAIREVRGQHPHKHN